MQKSTTVKDVAKGNADLTDIRFDIVKQMLDIDPHLRKRVYAYLKVYHLEHKCTTVSIGCFVSFLPFGTYCTTLFNSNDTLQIVCGLAIVLTMCLIVYAYTVYIKIQRIKK